MLLEFLRKLAHYHYPLRPPGALAEEAFLNRCIRCRKCEEICPYDSIVMAHGDRGLKVGTPFIYARREPCYLCMKCTEVCPTGALQLLKREEKKKVKMGVAKIDTTSCLAYNGIICRACYERCPIYREAITLKDQIYPVVHPEHCVGCGICENVCPNDPASIIVMSAHG